MKKNYGRFGAMIATATIVMFGLMYLNTYEPGHISFSETRVYMAILMGATMAILMLLFMLSMYRNRRVNVAIFAGSALLFFLALWLVRSQSTVGDISWMKAMIPHHSIAILTSERAQISDPRVRKLSKQIIESQRREIAEMKMLVEELKKQPSSARENSRHTSLPAVADPDAAAAKVPSGFKVDVVIKNLTYPTSAIFDEQGNLYVAEAGYSYGDGAAKPRVSRISPNGEVQVLEASEYLIAPINDLLWHDGLLYISHRGKISVVEDEQVRDLVTDLPSDGDHQNNQMSVGPDGKIYFGQGTASNSGVIGVDNFKMGWLAQHPKFHDVPPKDLQLRDQKYTTRDPLTNEKNDSAVTYAFHQFGKVAHRPLSVPGKTKANGTILRMNKDGSDLEVYAWGFRNPFGVLWAGGTLYASENGFDVRGSRPIANDEEDLYEVRQGAWYGWPDFASGIPVTDPQFKPESGPQPQFLMEQHPPVEKPLMTFPKHSAAAKLAVASNEIFGKGHLFLAFFGHMAPMTGEVEDHGGHRIVRIDLASRTGETFFSKGHHAGGHGSSEGGSGGGGHSGKDESVTAGPRPLVDVVFSPAGDALYIVDFGSMIVKREPQPIRDTGVIWRVTREGQNLAGHPPSELTFPESKPRRVVTEQK